MYSTVNHGMHHGGCVSRRMVQKIVNSWLHLILDVGTSKVKGQDQIVVRTLLLLIYKGWRQLMIKKKQTLKDYHDSNSKQTFKPHDPPRGPEEGSRTPVFEKSTTKPKPNLKARLISHNSVSRPVKIYIHHLCTDTGCRLEDDKDGWRQRESKEFMLAAQLYDDDDDQNSNT